jgi:hypothetical protein
MRNKKQWLAVIFVFSALAITFIWGGDNNGGLTGYDKNNIETQNVNNTALPQKTNEQYDEEYNTITDTNVRYGYEYTADLETKVLPDKSAKETKSSDTDKGQKKEVIKKKETESEKQSHNAILGKTEIEKSTNQEYKKDKYLTDPVPEGKPKPVEWQDTTINNSKEFKCTLSVTCKTILNNMDKFNMDKLEVLPEDGIIYKTQTVTFNEGESVFDVLQREMKKNKIHMEFEMTPIYNSNYIEGIHNLYEFDCGELSGWMYKVNGWFPNYGCSRYMLNDGDVVEWIYTCDLGRDIGGEMAVGGE